MYINMFFLCFFLGRSRVSFRVNGVLCGNFHGFGTSKPHHRGRFFSRKNQQVAHHLAPFKTQLV